MNNEFKSENYFALKSTSTNEYVMLSADYYFERIKVMFHFNLKEKQIFDAVSYRQDGDEIDEQSISESIKSFLLQNDIMPMVTSEKISSKEFKNISMDNDLWDDFVERIYDYKEHSLTNHINETFKLI